MIPIWGNARNNATSLIKTLQNCAIKTIKRLPYLHPTSEIYDKKLLSINSLLNFETLVLIYKIKNQLIKCNIDLRSVSHIHSYPTRQASNFYISYRNTTIGQKNIFYEGLRTFNSLPNSLKSESSLNRFKKNLKNYLHLNNQNINFISI